MKAQAVESTLVHDGWTVEPAAGPLVPRNVAEAGPVPATVPGCVHTDLLAAGLIADPFVGTNEKAQEWIGSTSWRYRTEFARPASDAEHLDLVFEGLDTIATVLLNGAEILRSRNQHRSFRVPIVDRLVDGPNRLEVVFDAPVPEADRASLELGYRPHVNHHPYNSIRKMACSFGWDWGLDTATSGIWRPVRLEAWSTARIAELVVTPTVDGTEGRVSIRVAVESTTDSPLTLRATLGGTDAEGPVVEGPVVDGLAQLELRVPDVERWWPRGYGEQPRYDLLVELDASGTTLDHRSRRIGFRSVRADMTPDAAGVPFVIVVNDQPVYVKGVNWIPDDAFPSRVDTARYRQRLTQAADANVNLVRVWGGGIYESDDFYDIADELGLLTWQDFLLACAAYAEEEPLYSEIAAEAREAIVRLSSHPSLVIFNGNNENAQGFVEWGWQPRLEGRTWGAGYYDELFPSLVRDLAPHVVYTPASPFSTDRRLSPNDETDGTMHTWELWNRQDYPRYRELRPRFVSEFGWQGPPTWSTLQTAAPDQPLTPESPSMLVHQKAQDGDVKLIDGLVHHLPLPNTMPEWHWAMGLNQAIAIRTAIEWFRSLQPHNMGAILWQLNDTWPAISWAAVDGYGLRKPLWYALRAAYADRLVTIQPEGPLLEVAVINDTASPWSGDLRVTRRTFEGEVLAESTNAVDVAARSAARFTIDAPVAGADHSAGEVLVAELEGVRGYWYFAEARDSALPPAEFDATVRAVEGGVEVTVTALTFIRDLGLLADVVDPEAEADDMLISLLPGESTVIRVRTAGHEDPERFIEPTVLRTLNELLVHQPVPVRA